MNNDAGGSGTKQTRLRASQMRRENEFWASCWSHPPIRTPLWGTVTCLSWMFRWPDRQGNRHIRGSRILALVRPRMQAAGVQCPRPQIAAASPDPQTRTFPGVESYVCISRYLYISLCIYIYIYTYYYYYYYDCFPESPVPKPPRCLFL